MIFLVYANCIFLSYPRCSFRLTSPFPPPLCPLTLPILRFAGVVTISLRKSNCKSLIHSEFKARQQQTVLKGSCIWGDAEYQFSMLSYLPLEGRVRVHDNDFGVGDCDGDTLSKQSEDVIQVLEKAFTRYQYENNDRR